MRSRAGASRKRRPIHADDTFSLETSLDSEPQQGGRPASLARLLLNAHLGSRGIHRPDVHSNLAGSARSGNPIAATEVQAPTDGAVSEDERYKKTVILPDTTFSQRANAINREPEIQKYWKEKQIYERMWEDAQGEPFTLHDGPPYANGDLHIGHALNKILKDTINKYQAIRGRKVRYVPGWDCHGLPIELKVLQNMKKDEKKNLTPPKLRERARDFAVETVSKQKESFQRYGVWGDFEEPYLTLKPEYEAAQIGVFGKMVENGHIFRGRKPVNWSPSSRTALAEAELEYPEGHISQSLYAAFPVRETADMPEFLRPFVESGNRLGIAIWTTTPWTLPANLAVAVNDRLDYVVVELPEGWQKLAGVQQGELTPTHVLCAKDLVPSLSKAIGVDEDLPIKATMKGADLSGRLTYSHPFAGRDSPVVAGGDYITTETGTGLVHTAPGHGAEDYLTGMKNNLEILSPVDDGGKFTEEAEAGLEGTDYSLKGLSVLGEGNTMCLKLMNSTGALLKVEPYNHKYPYDWRTKKPTIFRATDQWFASVEAFRDEAMSEIDKVKWFPSTGQNRISSFVSSRAEWCISRQRTWGVPIPVFYHKETGEPLLTKETIKHVQDIFAEHGSDAWFTMETADLLPESLRAEADHYERGRDTMDVWFDSGTSWAGVVKNRERLTYPADMYLEGSDQHRGWFQSSLLTSVASTGKAPYKAVLTHGFVNDEKGRKMSKSIGNVVSPSHVIEGGKNKKQQPAYGADVLRLWVANSDYSNDVSIGDGIIKQTFESYRKIRNTLRYFISNLNDFDPSSTDVSYDTLPQVDLFILSRLSSVVEEVEDAYEKFQFSRVVQTLLQFLSSDISNFYLEIAKDRLYISAKNDERRRTCQFTINILLRSVVSLLAPILPHLAEDVFLNLPHRPADKDSIFQLPWPTLDKSKLATKHDLRTWQQFFDLRDDVNIAAEKARKEKAIGSGLDAKVTIVKPNDAGEYKDLLDFLEEHQNSDNPLETVDDLSRMLITSQAKCEDGDLNGHEFVTDFKEGATPFGVIIEKAVGKKCARCWHFHESVGENEQFPGACEKCVKALLADDHDV